MPSSGEGPGSTLAVDGARGVDHLVDRSENCLHWQRNLIGYYSSRGQTWERVSTFTREALAAARELDPGPRHELIVAAMASFYLASMRRRWGDGKDRAGGAARARLDGDHVARGVAMRKASDGVLRRANAWVSVPRSTRELAREEVVKLQGLRLT
jgi:hypothetical protein